MRKLFEEYGMLALSLISGTISIEIFKSVFFIKNSGMYELIAFLFNRL